MEMKQRDIIHGFVVQKVRKIPELKATLYELEYVKNGAQLVWLDNGENNKLFSVTFKTLPQDDTGVFHILEHSVLGGSKGFPVKEPFVELLKGSMNTLLNAMTFPDKTIFPVSSRNKTDFMNLVSVYLDAVFFPAIYENPCIFEQEGWHYELWDEKEEPIYKGVVFNEMKGAFSSKDTLLKHGLNRLLFPDNCYGHVSGGDPKRITDLSYEQFLATHGEYYHPSNARIYLDGDVPLDQVLTLLDEEYLSKFQRSNVNHEIKYQEPVMKKVCLEYYEISEEESLDEKTQMALGKIVCDWTDRKRIMALCVLSSYLTGSNGAPLKEAILRNNLGQDVYIEVSDGMAQAYCSINIFNTEYQHRMEIKDILRKTAESLLVQGLDRKELEAAINQIEFQIRISEEPRGLERNINAMNSWLYGGDPILYLTNDELFTSLRQELDTEYFEDLLKLILLDESHMVELYLLPSKTKGIEDAEKEREGLAKKKKAWSEEEIQLIINRNRKLAAWQEKVDTIEELATLPQLSIYEVDSVPEEFFTERTQMGQIPILFHPVKDSGIVHFNLYFPLTDCSIEELSAVSFMTNLLGELPTRYHTVAELQQKIKKSIGLLDYNVTVYSVPGHRERCKPYWVVSCSALKDSVNEAVELIVEIINETVFDSEESAVLIEDILIQCNESLRQSIMMEGHRFALSRGFSHSSANGAVRERIEGYDFYCWLKLFSQNYESQIEAFQIQAQRMQSNVFSSERMTIGITATEVCHEFQKLAYELDKPNHQLPPEYMTVNMSTENLQEVVQIPAGISYTASGSHLEQYGRRYTGGLRVLATILSFDYLWNEVRVQGGAYGCGFQVSETGNVGFYSYRDPDPIHSQQVYCRASEFVRQFCADDKPIDKYIISTLAATEPLRTARSVGMVAESDYFNEISFQERIRIRKEILDIKKEDLLEFCDLLDDMAEGNAKCIIGNREAISQCDHKWLTYTL